MIVLKTIVRVPGLSCQSVGDFMVNCSDEEYRRWWPGTHMAFHTINRYNDNMNNLVYFDEYVGKRRLKFKAVVVKNIPGREIIWQIKKLVRLPGWAILELTEHNQGVMITHILKVGFPGIGRVLDPLIKLYLNQKFSRDLDNHVRIEFAKLAEFLENR